MAKAKQLSGAWQEAEKELQRAIAIAPDDGRSRLAYAFHLACLGQLPESLAEIQQALELSPGSLEINGQKGLLLYCARQYDQALKQLQKTLEMAPKLNMAHVFMGCAYMEKGQYTEALAALQQASDISGNPELEMWVAAAQGMTYARMGQREMAQKALDTLMSFPKQGDRSLMIALVYFALEENDLGFEWLARAYEERNSGLLLIKVWPSLDRVRSDVRYIALLKKMGLKS